MKKKTNRDLIIFVILIPIFLWLAFFISARMENSLPKYSVLNKSKNGCSIYFETLKELKYPVERILKQPNAQEINNIQILPESRKFDINSTEVKEWVQKGGVLIYLSGNELPLLEFGIPKIKENITIYEYEKGSIIVLNGYHLTNKAIAQNSNIAYELLEEIQKYKYEKIYFNEQYLYSEGEEKSFWDYISIEFKFIIYQIVLVLIAFFLYKGRRFGKIVPLYEETERSENEYLYSAAGLYKEAKCFDLMIENYYKSFLKQLNYNDDNWLDYWEEENLPQYNKAKKVYEFINNPKKKYKGKDCIKIITMLDDLKNILVKRRDVQWKDLKKPL